MLSGCNGNLGIYVDVIPFPKGYSAINLPLSHYATTISSCEKDYIPMILTSVGADQIT